MSYEPRMRGSRFRRQSAKKSSKSKPDDREAQFVYQETELVDPDEVSSKTLNALEHLGNQRFVLPPFSEHFQRWMTDLRTVLTEFKTQLPEATDQEYNEHSEKAVASIQGIFTERTAAEQSTSEKTSDLQNNLTQREAQIAKLENEQKTHLRETRRRFEKSQERLRREIDSLDKKRLKMLRKNDSFLRRVFRRSESRIEENTRVLETKKRTLENSREVFERESEKSKSEHQSELERLRTEAQELHRKLKQVRANTADDALDARKLACEELHQAVEQAMLRFGQRKELDDSASSQ
jgi:DNA repair exonuclease SbcCD ATPase subunit